MICRICGEETDNPDGICDECKFSVIDLDGISPNMQKYILFQEEKNSMIHIKCKKCGWRLPFSSKRNEDTVKNRRDSNIACPNCGEILIKRGGKMNG